ncbi:DUF427 domain-containing protein [Streptomyces sp. NPDC058685]|uniref:DUF427 domain-containing protein n=1 Tax=Streptomyces sp. NPDC058685 TaxID=3346598 RepID=UPI003654709F
MTDGSAYSVESRAAAAPNLLRRWPAGLGTTCTLPEAWWRLGDDARLHDVADGDKDTPIWADRLGIDLHRTATSRRLPSRTVHPKHRGQTEVSERHHVVVREVAAMRDESSQWESVWDYPRPPLVVEDARRVLVEFDGRIVADTAASLRVLETSHPPVFYIPPADIDLSLLFPTPRTSWCEWKGRASYWDVALGDQLAQEAAWSYEQPSPQFEQLASYVAFYPQRLGPCTVGGETVRSQPGDFYGGWITSEITGPFKGGAGTATW